MVKRTLKEIMLLLQLPAGDWEADEDSVKGMFGTFCRIGYDDKEYGGTTEPEMKRDTARLISASQDLLKFLVESVLNDLSIFNVPKECLFYINEVREHPERHAHREKFDVLEKVFAMKIEDILYRR